MGEPTPPLPFVSLLWLMSFPSGWPPAASIKKESLPVPLAFTLTRLFLLNTHENTQPWLDCSLSYFSQIPLGVVPFKASPRFLFWNHDTGLTTSRMSSCWLGFGNKCQLWLSVELGCQTRNNNLGIPLTTLDIKQAWRKVITKKNFYYLQHARPQTFW